MDAMAVGNRLVELCKAGENKKAIEELYADSVDVREAMEMPNPEEFGMYPNGVQTKEQLLKSADAFFEMHEIHGGDVDGPYPHGDDFIVFMSLDTTPKVGPMAGQRMQMKEACHYGVKNGKIVSSHFYYGMPGGDCG